LQGRGGGEYEGSGTRGCDQGRARGHSGAGLALVRLVLRLGTATTVPGWYPGCACRGYVRVFECVGG
jgi:hypothetical protein